MKSLTQRMMLTRTVVGPQQKTGLEGSPQLLHPQGEFGSPDSICLESTVAFFFERAGK